MSSDSFTDAAPRAPERAHEAPPAHRVGASLEANEPGHVSPALKTAQDNKALEDSKTLPKLSIAGDAKPKDWTVAVELGASLPADPEHPKGLGAQNQLDELKKLAKETEGKSVNFVVHAELPVDARGKLCNQGDDVAKNAACTTQATDAGRATTQRYFIHDGKIERLPDVKYKKGEDSIQGLLKDAGKLAPSDKLGLIVQSHGVGADGIATNLGPASLDKTVGAIAAGLKGSGHEKLDFLDFDACDMSATKVMDASSKVAKDVVASAAFESASKTSDGQNLKAGLHALLDNSKMSGKDLGETFVKQASEGANGSGDSNSVTTLSNFDMSHYPQFKASLDRLGRALNDSAISGGNGKQIVDDIDKTVKPQNGDEGDGKDGPMPTGDRDVKDFGQKVLADIKAGKYNGDTKELEDATREMLKSFDQFATKQYSDKAAGYDSIGGLNTSLPGRDVLDTKSIAAKSSPLNMISENVKVLSNDVDVEQKGMVANTLKHSVEALERGWGNHYPKELASLKHAMQEINRAQDTPSFRAALNKLGELTKQMDDTPAGAQARKSVLPAARDQQQMFLTMPTYQLTPGWDQFIANLRASAR